MNARTGRLTDLPDQRVMVDADPALCFEVIASGGREIERTADDRWVAEFDDVVGGHRVVTREEVVAIGGRSLRYTWLDGPLPEVTERIDVLDAPGGGTVLRHRGSFRTEAGIVRDLVGRFVVRRAFARAVRRHLTEARDTAERRQLRSRVHPRAGRGDEGG